MKKNKGNSIIAVIAVIAIVVLLVTLSVKSSFKQAGEITGQAVSITYPEPTDYVVDEAGALTPDELISLNDTVAAQEREIGVAIIETTGGMDITQYGIELADRWKVGDEALDDGAIIIIATEDRKVRIEVGSGLEGEITDAEAGRIIDELMVPFLKDNQWYEAVLGGVVGITNQYE